MSRTAIAAVVLVRIFGSMNAATGFRRSADGVGHGDDDGRGPRAHVPPGVERARNRVRGSSNKAISTPEGARRPTSARPKMSLRLPDLTPPDRSDSRLLEAVRQYAQLLDASLADEIQHRHTRRFLELAEQSESAVRDDRAVWPLPSGARRHSSRGGTLAAGSAGGSRSAR